MSDPVEATNESTALARIGGALRAILGRAAPAAGLIVLFIYFGATARNFLTPDNQIDMTMQIAVVALLAIGETFVIVSGGIDLSVGSVLALSSVITALCVSPKEWDLPVSVGVAAGVAAGTFCGLVNGVLITRAKLPPFIATLGMMGICRGFAKVATDAQAIPVVQNEAFTGLGSNRVIGGFVPIPIIILLVVALLSVFILRFTRLGRYCYAMGSNWEATRLSGVNVNLNMTVVYVICGLLSGIAGVVQTARLGIGQPTGGIAYELDAIAAAVIGGASLMGGIGTVSGTMLGAFIIAVLRNGCDLKNVSPHWQEIVIGAAIVLAVLVDRIRQR